MSRSISWCWKIVLFTRSSSRSVFLILTYSMVVFSDVSDISDSDGRTEVSTDVTSSQNPSLQLTRQQTVLLNCLLLKAGG